MADLSHPPVEFADRLLAECVQLEDKLEQLRAQIVATTETAMLQEVGVYEFRHPMEAADAYKAALDDLRSKIKQAVKNGTAVRTTTREWTVNDSAAKGRKMIKDTSKLLLRAYNNEADTLIYKLRPFRLDASLKRLEQSRRAINRLGAQPMEINIPDSYHRLRVRELELASDWLAKKEEEKEAAKAERARLREEARARKEIEAERLRLIKERTHYEGVVARLREAGGTDADIAELQAEIAEIEQALTSVEERAANTRAGHVYVISNLGSFGERMVKIGMTRRLDPMDRVRELGDASVPFGYDLHALAFSEDAVALEKRLHDRFAIQRVNLVNKRREFFYLTPAEVKAAIVDEGLNTVVTEFIEEAPAEQWRVSENTRQGTSARA